MHVPQRNYSFKNITKYCVNFSKDRSFAPVKSKKKKYIYLRSSRAQTNLFCSILSIECDIVKYRKVNGNIQRFLEAMCSKKQ